MGELIPHPSAPEAFIIVYHGRLMVAVNPHPRPNTDTVGWRAWVWTRSLEAADKWGTREGAEQFAENAGLRPGYEIRPVTAAAMSEVHA